MRRRPGKRRRGVTLIELLVALTIATLITMAAGTSYIYGAQTQQSLGNGRDVIARRVAFESSLRDLFSHIYLDSDSSNQNTYFISGDALASKSVDGNSVGSSSTAGEDSLAFTVVGRRLPSSLLATQDDFETNNDRYGPLGGIAEIQLGTTPVGTPQSEQDPGGLYLREQAPSDTDPTQGGLESRLSKDVDTIRFEYYDGTQWLTTWDTTTMGTRRLPSAVRVTYKFKDETTERILVLGIPTSDVTPDNPVEDTTA